MSSKHDAYFGHRRLTISLHFFFVNEIPGVHFMSIAASGRFQSTIFSLRSLLENNVWFSCPFFTASYLLIYEANQT
jgi:hypothetical protein